MNKELVNGMEELSTFDNELLSLIERMNSAVNCGEYSVARSLCGTFENVAYRANSLANYLADIE